MVSETLGRRRIRRGRRRRRRRRMRNVWNFENLVDIIVVPVWASYCRVLVTYIGDQNPEV